MRPVQNRIRELRLERGLTQDDLARRAHTSAVQVSRLERGERSVTVEWIMRLAEGLGCRPGEILPERGGFTAPQTIPLVGYVGAGDRYYPEAEFGPWVGFDTVDAPPGASRSIVAVRVRGESMAPVYRPGDLIYFDRDQRRRPEELTGKDCVVQIAGDGPVYLKRLRRRRGQFVLESYGGDDIEGVQILWATPVVWIQRA